MENIDGKELTLYYSVNYALTDVPDDVAYFHAQFYRQNPLPEGDVFTTLYGVMGHYVGAYLSLGAQNYDRPVSVAPA